MYFSSCDKVFFGSQNNGSIVYQSKSPVVMESAVGFSVQTVPSKVETVVLFDVHFVVVCLFGVCVVTVALHRLFSNGFTSVYV